MGDQAEHSAAVELFNTVFEQDAMGMAIRDIGPRDSRWLRVNQKLCDIFGYTREEMLQLTTVDVSPPEEQHIAIKFNEQLLRGEIRSYSREKRYVRKDGRIFWANIWLSPILGPDGYPTQLIQVLQDITERKQAEAEIKRLNEELEHRVEKRTRELTGEITERKQVEEALRKSEGRLRGAIESLQEGFVLFDADDRLVAINDVYRAINPKAQEFLEKGMRFEDITRANVAKGRMVEAHGREEEFIRERLQQHRNPKGPILRQFNDGRWTLIKETRTPEGGMALTITDITDLKRTEEALRQSQKMEAVGQLTGGVAHDFNNLLAVISLNLALVAEISGLEGEPREKLDRALAAVDRGAHLTDQLLTFSRQQTLNPETIEANTLLFDTINLLMRTLGEDIDIKTAFDTHIPLIKVDPVMLGNAILNMALNARDAMPKGGTLTIKTASSVDLDGQVLYDNQGPLTGPHVLISISDTGTGIKKKYLDRVFEPFFTRKGVGEGSGLGLSMVYGFVKQSGGHVTIDSKRGKGTTVNLYFPAAEKLDAKNKEKSATRPKTESIGTETIMVVEDDEDVRQATLFVLERLGYKVLEAEDGPSALERIKILEGRSVSIDLVFSDVIMPSGMSGVDLANELRRHYQDIKVLMTSGYPEKVIDKYEIDDSGITLLRKPYKMTDLADALRSTLDQ